MKLKATHFILPALAAAAMMALPGEVLASSHCGGGTTATGNQAILSQSCSMVATIQTWIFRIAYILGAIGLVVIAVSAFLGRFKFAHLIALGGGLFIVAAADALIKFVSSGSGAMTQDCNTF
jgi:hypothetical protein